MQPLNGRHGSAWLQAPPWPEGVSLCVNHPNARPSGERPKPQSSNTHRHPSLTHQGTQRPKNPSSFRAKEKTRAAGPCVPRQKHRTRLHPARRASGADGSPRDSDRVTGGQLAFRGVRPSPPPAPLGRTPGPGRARPPAVTATPQSCFSEPFPGSANLWVPSRTREAGSCGPWPDPSPLGLQRATGTRRAADTAGPVRLSRSGALAAGQLRRHLWSQPFPWR